MAEFTIPREKKLQTGGHYRQGKLGSKAREKALPEEGKGESKQGTVNRDCAEGKGMGFQIGVKPGRGGGGGGKITKKKTDFGGLGKG